MCVNSLEMKPGMKGHKEGGLIFKEQQQHSTRCLNVVKISRAHAKIEIVMNFTSILVSYRVFCIQSDKKYFLLVNFLHSYPFLFS